MSSSQLSPNTTPAEAAAFPILLRMPDLRPKKGGEKTTPTVPPPSEPESVPEPVVEQPEPPPAPPAAESEPTPPEPVVEAPKPVAEEPPPPSPAGTEPPRQEPSEPVSPMVARRQRALERQRRQAEQMPSAPRSWWTSHLPVIAVGFLLALVFTIFIARQNRNVGRQEQAASDPEVRTLDIDIGEPSDSSMLPELAVETNVPEAKPVSKSPPLLSAKPKLLDEPTSFSTEKVTPAAAEDALPTASEAAAPVAAEAPVAEASEDYPSTDPTAYRPGGRVPKTARTYPQTSTPHLR